VTPLYSSAFFHEMVVQLPLPVNDVLEFMLGKGLIAGLDLSPYYPEFGHALLICVTETKSVPDIDTYARLLASAIDDAKKAEEC